MGLGVSASQMSGTPTSKSNAVICSPGAGTVGQYDLLSDTFDSIVAHDTAGTTNMSVTQSGGQTIMRWSRLVNNGDVNDTQISTMGNSTVLFAVGSTNTFHDEFPSTMHGMSVALIPSVTYEYSVTLNTSPLLVLNWNVVGDRLDFQAVLSQLSW